jgi:hypothetical protein
MWRWVIFLRFQKQSQLSRLHVLAMSLSLVLLLGSVRASAVTASSSEQSPEDCPCLGRVGNVNCDYRDMVTIGDVSFLIDHLFISGIRLPNKEEANINGDSLGIIDIADVSLLIDHLFISLAPLPYCPEELNHPPITRIVAFIEGVPFVNSVSPVNSSTGIRMRWTGADTIDYPTDPPPFEFEWRLYGPYNDSLFHVIGDSLTVAVLRTRSGELLRTGDTVCDTSWTGGIRQIINRTLLLDTMPQYSRYGEVKEILEVDEPAFSANTDLNRLAASSLDHGDLWTARFRDSIYDVYSACPADTTRSMNFIFWVRSRESIDTMSVDPTPAWKSFRVIDPQFERDVLVLNFYQNGENRAYGDSTRSFWDNAAKAWIAMREEGSNITFDTAVDYIGLGYSADPYVLLERALRHKVLILTQDVPYFAGLASETILQSGIVPAIILGANAWVAARVPVGYFSFMSTHQSGVKPVSVYASMFGVVSTEFPGWGYGIYTTDDGDGLGLPRAEDFVGANSQNLELWPDLVVDTALLHRRYKWEGSLEPLEFPFYPFIDTIGALPQVGWAEPVPTAEVMYRYRSRYGDDHPYAGMPVMHRLQQGHIRTVHSMFTPLSIEAGAAQQLVSSVLDWLYDGFDSPLAPRSTGASRSEAPRDGGQ